MDNRCGSQEKAVCIHAGWLIDGTGSEPQADVLIHIRNGRFHGVETAKGRDGVAQEVVDMRNATVIPGLIDCHIHLAMSGTENPQSRQEQLAMDYETAAMGIRQRLDAHCRYGLVALRDGGDRNGFTLRYRQEQTGEHDEPIVLQSPGHAWRKAGRYGKTIAKGLAADEDPFSMLPLVNRGCDHIKLLNSGVCSLTEYGKETAPQFTAEEMDRFVRAAAAMNKPVMVHANGRNPVKIAVEAGCASIEHGYFMGKANLKRMADRKTIWVPTVVPMAAYSAILPMGTRKACVAAKTRDHQLEQLHQARQAGVRVAIGTDSGSIGVHHGASVYQEMRLLIEAGYGVHESVRSATTEGASLLGFDMDRLFANGNRAVFLAIDGPPSRLRENLLQVRLYGKKGFQAPVRVRTDFRFEKGQDLSEE